MSATLVMNNADLVSHQILPFVLAPKPSCCENCRAVLPLHIFKIPFSKHTFTHKSFPTEYFSLQDIPKEFKDNEDLMASVKVVSFFGENNQWYCDRCWWRNVAYHTPIYNEGWVADAIKKANPTFDEKQIKKELKLIHNCELLFKTHRIKKTQEKAKLYEEFVYSALREFYALVKKELKDEGQAHQDSIAKYIMKKRMRVCRDNSNHWVKEIRQRKIAKWFAERKIPQKFYSITASQLYNHSPFPTWEEITKYYEGYTENQNRLANGYEQKGDLVKAKQYRCPPLPKWWNDL
jgi:hypothetical protein